MEPVGKIPSIFWQWVTQDEYLSLVHGLKYCTRLHTLVLRDKNLGSKEVKALSEGHKFCKNLKEIDLRGNQIGPSEIQDLVSVLVDCKHLHFLCLNRNKIATVGANIIFGNQLALKL